MSAQGIIHGSVSDSLTLDQLKGAEITLKYIETITVEVYREELYKGCARHEEIIEFLKERGFVQTDVFWRGNTWGDAKFRRVHNAD